DPCILTVIFGLIVIAALTDAEHRASDTNARTELLDRTSRHLFASRWRYHFFSIASRAISAFKRSSAYIFLRRRFSASSSLSRAIIEVSIPPYLARYL